MSDRNRLNDKVSEYQEKYRNPDLPKFKVSDPYDLKADWDAGKSYPLVNKQGAYAIFDTNENLLYIGKASQNNTLGNRLGSYFKYAPDGKSCTTPPNHNWSSDPRYVMTVAVAYPFEAPSLEEYLIGELQPLDNSRGKITSDQ